MADDDLMNALTALARDESDHDPRLDAVVRGVASDTELRLLEAEAKDDPELAAALEAFRPLDRATVDRIADASVEAYGPAAGAKIIPFPRRGPLAIAAVAAAAAAVFFLSPMQEPTPLAPYTAEFIGGDKAFRGAEEPKAAPAAVPTFSPTSRVEFRGRPAVAVTEPVEAAAYFVHDGTAHDVPVELERSEEGAVRLVGSANALFGDRRGEVVLYLAIGPPGVITRERAVGADDRPEALQVFSKRLRLVDPPR